MSLLCDQLLKVGSSKDLKHCIESPNSKICDWNHFHQGFYNEMTGLMLIGIWKIQWSLHREVQSKQVRDTQQSRLKRTGCDAFKMPKSLDGYQ